MQPVVRALFLLAASAAAALAQCQNAKSVSPRNIAVETTGGLRYLKFSYPLMCPQVLWKSAPLVQGTNVSQTLFLVDGAQQCGPTFPPPTYTNNATLVLGRFAPSNYLCRIYTILPFEGGATTLLAEVPFNVNAGERTLSQLSVDPGKFIFRVNGTSNVTYRVQSSVSLTNWTSIRTNLGAPFWVTNTMGTNLCYRVQASDEVSVCP